MVFTREAGEFKSIGAFEAGNAQLITIDAENVLTPYSDPTIYPESMVVIDGLLRSDRRITKRYLAVATNNKDPEYVHVLQEQIPDIKVFSAIDYANKKTSSDMFLAACAEYGVNPSVAIHIDDQYLSFRGAKLAKFSEGILVTPTGSNEHKGVKFGRLLDRSVRITLGSKQLLSNYFTDGIDY